MRVLIVDTCYPAFLRSHYDRDPGLGERPYDEQWRALMDTFFGTADSYSHHLRAAGHEAHEVVVNCEPLQEAWAREHLRSFRRLRRAVWPRGELVLEQAAWFEPDVVYVQDLGALSPPTLSALRRGRLLAGQIASELPDRARVRAFELVLTSFPHYVERLESLGVASEYFRIGFDPRVLDRLDTARPRRGAVFVGALGRRQHSRGNELLARAAERVPIDFYGYGADDWPEGSVVRRCYRGEAWGLEMLQVLARAEVALNRHIDVAEDFANNMRLYEATGVGTLLLTDEKRNLSDLFEPGAEVVPYRDEDELVERLRYYLDHREERQAIALAGQRRTLTEHSYEVRMRELADILGRRLP